MSDIDEGAVTLARWKATGSSALFLKVYVAMARSSHLRPQDSIRLRLSHQHTVHNIYFRRSVRLGQICQEDHLAL